MLLKKSVARVVYATIESRRSAIRIKVALATGLLNQSCAAAPSKSFFNTIDPLRTWSYRSAIYGISHARLVDFDVQFPDEPLERRVIITEELQELLRRTPDWFLCLLEKTLGQLRR
jgi:hypothetical protein